MPLTGPFQGGKWKAQCDVCGRVFLNDEIQLTWDNSRRCRTCWEPRHPQDFVRGVIDNPSTPWARPWLPNLSQVQTLNPTSAGGVHVPTGSLAILPGAFPGVAYYLATITGNINGVEAESFEVVSIIQGSINIGVDVVLFFGARGLNGTTQQTWDAGAFLTAITPSIPV